MFQVIGHDNRSNIPYSLKQQNGHVPKMHATVPKHNSPQVPRLNRPRAEAALARAQNRIKVASDS